MCEIGQKLSTRTAPEKGYVRRTTVKVPMDQKFFKELSYSFGRGRSRFNVTAEDLDHILPVGWSERAFRTSTKCVVSREHPITIRFANQRKVHFDHSECPRCQWLLADKTYGQENHSIPTKVIDITQLTYGS